MALIGSSHGSNVHHQFVQPKQHIQSRPQFSKNHSGTTNSDTDDGTFSENEISAPVDQHKQNEAQAAIGVSISRQQTRLASPVTPAVEKAAAIQGGGGYFQPDGHNDQSSLDGLSCSECESIEKPESGNEGLAPENLPHKEDQAKIDQDSPSAALATVSETVEQESSPSSRHSQTLTTPPPRKSSDAERVNRHSRSGSHIGEYPLSSRRSHSTTRSSIKNIPSRQNQFHRPSMGHHRASSDGSLSARRALSTASSLGDDTRFENVKEQVNSRFKAIKDSFQDSNFRLPKVPPMPNLPNLPRLPNILSVVSRNPQKEDYGKHVTAPDCRDSVIETLRKRAGSKSKPFSAKDQDTNQSTSGKTATNAAIHPYFTKALEQLTGDIVILGGYRGSVLRSKEPPHQRLWFPLKAGFNLQRINLEVGLKDEDEETTPVFADGMLDHIGPVDISRRLLKRLRASPNAQSGKLRVHSYGYDWRLSSHRLSARLVRFLDTLPCNSQFTAKQQRGAIVIAHSLGGLITRHAVNERPDLFAGVLYAGAPQNCANVLGPLKHGDDVMFSSKVLTAQANFTMRSSYTFLPVNGKLYVDESTGEELPVDFFDVNTWIQHELSPLVAKPSRRNSRIALLDSFTPSISISKSIGDVMDNLPFRRRGSVRKSKTSSSTSGSSGGGSTSNAAIEHGMGPQMDSNNDTKHRARSQSRINITIPHADAVEYLRRTLAAAKQFKLETAHIEAHTQDNTYPPLAVLYGKSVPTVSTARVNGYEGIARPDVYDNLTFASGDGVVLAREAMLPDGYHAVKGGVVGSDRGHITLLSDLNAVGRALVALLRARRHGVGLGLSTSDEHVAPQLAHALKNNENDTH